MLTKETVLKRILVEAHRLGSKATTAKKAHAYIMQHQRKPFSGRVVSSYTRSTGRDLYKSINHKVRANKRSCVIPLGDNLRLPLERKLYKMYPRRQNWTMAKAEKSESPVYCAEVNEGQYSSRCTYTKWTYHAAIGSWGFLKGNLGLEFHYGGKISFCKAPFGYSWKKDRLGIFLVSSSDPEKNYHPCASDLTEYSVKKIRDILLANYRIRKDAEKLAKKELLIVAKNEKEFLKKLRVAEKEGMQVCFRDSVKAGNCAAGTSTFARISNLDVTKHYNPTYIYKIGMPIRPAQIPVVLLSALRRHKREMRDGFALLEDHK